MKINEVLDLVSNSGDQHLLVSSAAIAQHNRFNQCRPVQVVHTVQWRTGGNQLLHHAVMAQVGRCYQRGAVVAAGGEFGAGT